MDIKEFRKQINRGSGSIILFLRDNEHIVKKYYNAILYACTHNTAYDRQCDVSRAQYLWDIIQLSNRANDLQVNILKSLSEAEDGYDKHQIYELAVLFARSDNPEAIEVMQQAFKYDETWNCFIGAEEIINVEGKKGFIFVAEKIGEKILACPEYFEDNIILEYAYEQFGEDIVNKLLTSESKINDKVKAYFNSVNGFLETRQNNERKIESYDDIKRLIEESENSYTPRLVAWGRRASEDDLKKAAEDLLREKIKMLPYLSIFARRAFPFECNILIDFAKSKSKAAMTALWTLRNIKDSNIHDLAIELLQNNKSKDDALELLVKNFSERDIELIEKVFLKKHNKHIFHAIGMTLIEIFGVNQTKNCLNILVELYKKSLCSTCRYDCIKIMIENRIVPDWILNEAEFDCNIDTRQMVKEYSVK